MFPICSIVPDQHDIIDPDDSPQTAWVAAQLADLARLRAIGMEMAERIGAMQARLAEEPSEEALEGCATLTLAFTRVCRGIRQLVALEQEAAGLRDPHQARMRARRNADTARTLRLTIGGEVRQRRSDIDRETLKGMLGDLFRDYDDYDDYERGDIGPILERICKRLGVDPDPARWPGMSGAFSAEEEAALDARLMAEMDRIHEQQKEKQAWMAANGLDPP